MSSSSSYDIAREIFLRGLGTIYVVAFIVGLEQNPALIGTDGLTPGNLHMQSIRKYHNEYDPLKLYFKAPTLLWFIPEDEFDFSLRLIQTVGLGLALIPMLLGKSNMIIQFLIWILYSSITNVGQVWYSFGFEAQLLETGFLSIFLCSFFEFYRPTPISVVWLYRYLVIRIYFGAGMIKVRGDSCWKELTCMNYHYETTCVPNPWAWYMHHMPKEWHMIETLGNHIIQLIAPLFLMFSRSIRHVGAFFVALEMFLILSTGNYGFLNHMTMLKAIFAFDDDALWWVKHCCFRSRDEKKKPTKKTSSSRPNRHSALYSLFDWVFFSWIVYLSIPVLANILSEKQVMNTSFNSFSIVNTYGAFGSVNKVRYEVVVFGSHELDGDDSWVEIQFKCQPGDISRRPCFITPYHYRIDWLAWFVGFQSYQNHPWFLHYVWKLLEGDEKTYGLIAETEFRENPPKRIKVDRYQYSFTKNATASAWWDRSFVEPFLPSLSLDNPSLRKFIEETYGTTQRVRT